MPQSYIPDGRTDAFQIPEYQDIADAVEAFQAFADTCAHTDELTDHVADTTSVHGIPDTTALVTLTGSQTLTNKTLAAPTISNGATVTGTVTGVLQPSIVDAKGDLIVGTAADTAGRLAVGSNGQYLKADSSTATGLTWATQAPYAMSAARVDWDITPSTLASFVEVASVGLVTLTFPVGRFSQTPIVSATTIANDGTRSHWASFSVYEVSSSSCSLYVINSGAPASVTGGGSISKASAHVVAIQMTSGAGAG